MKLTLTRAAAMLMLVATALPAAAQEVTRSGANGTVTKTYEHGAGLIVNRNGVNGGSTSATVSCDRNGGVACQRDYTLTNSSGETVTGQRNSLSGPYRTRSSNTVTGPAGETVTRYRVRPRANRARRVLRRW